MKPQKLVLLVDSVVVKVLLQMYNVELERGVRGRGRKEVGSFG